MPIYQFDPQNHQIAKLNDTKFSTQGILERHLQTAFKNQIEAICPDTLIIDEEFSEWDDSKRRIDLLGIDRDGNIVVIELKRDEQGGHMELQALRYAAMVSTMTFDRVVDIYQKYLGENRNAESELRDFLGWGEEGKESEFPSDVRIILASADFDKEITSTVMWLNQRDLDIRCVRMKPYQLEDRLLLDIEQIIPLPEAQDYQVKIKQQIAAQKATKYEPSPKNKATYKFDGQVYGGGRLVLAVIKKICQDYPTYNNLDKLQQTFRKGIIGGFETVTVRAEGERILQQTGHKRHFLNLEDILRTADGEELIVCKEWTKERVENFIQYIPQEFGYTIEPIPFDRELN
jgi:hypothetical protein